MFDTVTFRPPINCVANHALWLIVRILWSGPCWGLTTTKRTGASWVRFSETHLASVYRKWIEYTEVRCKDNHCNAPYGTNNPQSEGHFYQDNAPPRILPIRHWSYPRSDSQIDHYGCSYPRKLIRHRFTEEPICLTFCHVRQTNELNINKFGGTLNHGSVKLQLRMMYIKVSSR